MALGLLVDFELLLAIYESEIYIGYYCIYVFKPLIVISMIRYIYMLISSLCSVLILYN